MRKELFQFLEEQKLVTLASVDEEGKPWISSVYYATDKDLNFYFVSKKTTKHSTHFAKKNDIAFSVSWFNPKDDEDRIAIQATGKVEELKSLKFIAIGAKLIFEKFDDWTIEPKSMIENLSGARMYRIVPTYIKFWNDKLLGKPATEEYTLNQDS